MAEYIPYIETLTLIPSSGGRFEVKVGEDLVFSKKTLGRHAQPGEIAGLLRDRYAFVESEDAAGDEH